jgi:hypothetical protein
MLEKEEARQGLISFIFANRTLLIFLQISLVSDGTKQMWRFLLLTALRVGENLVVEAMQGMEQREQDCV